MTKEEVALQLTLKAVDLGAVHLLRLNASNEESNVKVNAFNSEQIGDFYNLILSTLSAKD